MDAPLYTCPFCKQTSQNPAAARASAPPAASFVIVQQMPAPASAPVVHAAPGGGGVGAVRRVAMMLMPLVIVASVLVMTNPGLRASVVSLFAGWDGETPLVCDGNDHVKAEGVTATFTQGPAVVAHGNCRVELVGCTLKAAVAVQADGNAHVTVTNGSIEGSSAAVDAKGNAVVDLLGSVKTTGAVRGRVTGR